MHEIVRVQDRLTFIPFKLAHFLQLALADLLPTVRGLIHIFLVSHPLQNEVWSISGEGGRVVFEVHGKRGLEGCFFNTPLNSLYVYTRVPRKQPNPPPIPPSKLTENQLFLKRQLNSTRDRGENRGIPYPLSLVNPKRFPTHTHHAHSNPI